MRVQFKTTAFYKKKGKMFISASLPLCITGNSIFLSKGFSSAPRSNSIYFVRYTRIYDRQENGIEQEEGETTRRKGENPLQLSQLTHTHIPSTAFI